MGGLQLPWLLCTTLESHHLSCWLRTTSALPPLAPHLHHQDPGHLLSPASGLPGKRRGGLALALPYRT